MKKMWKRNQIMITALALMIAIAGYLNFMGKTVDEENLFTTSAQFEEANADVTDAENQSAQSDALAEESMAMVSDVTQQDDTLALITEDTEDSASLTDIDSMDSEEEMEYSDYLDEEQAQDVGGQETDIASTDGQAQEVDASDSLTAEVTDDYDGETPGEAVFTGAEAISSVASANLLKEQTRAKNKEALLNIINAENLPDSAKEEAVDSMITLTDIAQKECSAEILLEAKGFEDVVVSITGEMADVIVKADDLTQAQRAQIEDIVSRKTGIEAENIIISPVAEK